jgi:GNAT superfamily N-acetyltransferase
MLFVDQGLAARLELAHAWRGIHYARAQHALHPARAIQIEAVADGYAIYAGPGSPLNRVVGLGCSGPVTPAKLTEVERLYARQNAVVQIDLCPLADPSLLALLKSHHYRLAGFQSVLVLPLDQPDGWATLPFELEVRQAAPQDAERWIRTTAQGFEDTEEPSPDALDILTPNFYSANATCYWALINGEPAGGGAMYHQEGVVELGGASTRPAFRRRGVQTALIRARLAAARALGCEFAVALTEPGSDSQRNLMRKGFELAYTKAILVKE